MRTASQKKRDFQPADYGTDRLRHHHKVRFELVSARTGGAVRLRVIDQNEIDKLYHEGVINQIEHSTAEKMRRDLWLIGCYGKATSEVGSLLSVNGSDKIVRATSDAMARVRAALRVLDREAGEPARRLFITVMVDNRRVGMQDVPVIRACLAALLPLVERHAYSIGRLAKRAFGLRYY